MKLSLLLALAAGTLLPQRVDVEFDKSVDFSKYRTFAVRDGEFNSKMPALNNNSARRNLELSIRRHLSARGLTEVASRADLNVTYSLGSKEHRDIDRLASRRLDRRVEREETEGRLAIHLRDPGKGTSVWYAILYETQETPASVQAKLDHMVEKIFAKYPPVKK